MGCLLPPQPPTFFLRFFLLLFTSGFQAVGSILTPPPPNHTPPLLPLLTHISFCMWLFQRRQKPCVSAVDLTSFASRVPPLYALVSLESSMNRSAFILVVVSTSARLAASQLPLSTGLTRADAGPKISEVSGKTKNKKQQQQNKYTHTKRFICRKIWAFSVCNRNTKLCVIDSW